MRMDILVYACAAALLLTILPVGAVQSGNVEMKIEQWQINRLFNPGENQRKQEQDGMVFIYDGIKGNIVNRVMDEEFDRLDSMMFTRTIITDEEGDPVLHPETGLAMIEDDGC